MSKCRNALSTASLLKRVSRTCFSDVTDVTFSVCTSGEGVNHSVLREIEWGGGDARAGSGVRGRCASRLRSARAAHVRDEATAARKSAVTA